MGNVKKQIFVIFYCDEWKSTESMRVAMCTTSVRKVKSFIASKIEDDSFDYGNAESKSTQVDEFRNNFNELTRDAINCKLQYGYLDYSYDGEEW